MAAVGALLVGVLGAGVAAHRFWLRQLSHLTGDAEWVWTTDVLSRLHPTAGLFVAGLRLDAPPGAALLKVCGDREYVVWINGTAAACGWSRPGFRLDMYDVAHLLRQGSNVLAFEVRSPTPAGGLLCALDVDGVGRNVVVSGPDLAFRDAFSLAAPGPGDGRVPVRWGSPPRFPWSYPRPVSHPRTVDEVVIDDPVRIGVEEARVMAGGGWAFELPRPVFGYLWLELRSDGAAFLATRDEAEGGDEGAARATAQPVPRLRGQRRWLDPEPRQIARVYVFGREAPTAVEVWPVAEELRPVAPGAVRGKYGPEQRTRWRIRIPPG